MRRLTLVGDTSVLAYSTRHWIESEPKYVPIEMVPPRSHEVARVLPGVDPASLVGHLTAVDDEGNLWSDGSAELLVLWALRRYRARALRIGHPSRLPFKGSNLNWVAGGEGLPWHERSEHGGVVQGR